MTRKHNYYINPEWVHRLPGLNHLNIISSHHSFISDSCYLTSPIVVRGKIWRQHEKEDNWQLKSHKQWLVFMGEKQKSNNNLVHQSRASMTASTISWVVLTPPRSFVLYLPSEITRLTAVSSLSANDGN